MGLWHGTKDVITDMLSIHPLLSCEGSANEIIRHTGLLLCSFCRERQTEPGRQDGAQTSKAPGLGSESPWVGWWQVRAPCEPFTPQESGPKNLRHGTHFCHKHLSWGKD